MAHPFQGQHQMHPSQMQSHHQNIGQQRQAPMAQQQGPAMGQQRGMQMPNPAHSSTTNYNPQVALFTFERQKGAEGWEDVEAEQQHVNIQDLQNDVKKFQKSRNSVKRIMEEIPSSNARRLVNELVEEQNQTLMAINRTLQWTIASIDIKWKILSRSKRQLQRISVILQTGPSGYEDPHAIRAAAGMGAKVQPGNQNPSFSQQNQLAQDMQQPLRNPPLPGQPQMMQQGTQPMRPPQAHPQNGQGQLPPQQPPHPGLAHLPPPPAGATPLSHLPPPPPGVAPLSHLPPPPPPQGMPRQPPHAQQPRPMPGTFPGHAPHMRPGQPDIEILDSAARRKQKKHGGRQEESSSSESESDSDEWESESGDSVPDHFRVRNVEHGEFAHIGKPKRGRSRQSSRSKKPRHNRSHSKARNRSRSHGRSDNYRKRRDSDYIEPPPMGKYSPSSSKDSSPSSSKQQLPPIHIHMTTPVAEKTSRPSDRARRDSHGASSPDYRKEKFSAEPMSRGDSWDRHSGTASYNDNSSVHTADDSIFSEPERHTHRSVHRSDIIDEGRKLRSRNLAPRRDSFSSPRQESFGNPHPSHIYGDVDLRARRPTYPANDYPHDARQRDAFLYDDEHAYAAAARPPLVPRRTSTSNGIQTPQSNPFDTSLYPASPPMPPRLGRANTMGPGMMHEALYAQRERERESRYLSDRPAQDSLHLDELADAIEHVREQQKKRRPLQGRRASDYDRLGAYGRAYDMYERRY